MSYYYEKLTGKVAKHLARFPYYATDKILNLMQFQDSNQQFLISDKHLYDYFEEQKHQLSTDEKLSILFSLFKGRIDVYAKSYMMMKMEKSTIFLLTTMVGKNFLLERELVNP